MLIHYESAAFTHFLSCVDEGVIVGRGTRVWAFAHVVCGTVVGQDCNICDRDTAERQRRSRWTRSSAMV